jgi:REP element-mobilizing transposase RayT
MRRRWRQEELPIPNTWGGRRKNAGRKPKGEKAGVSHEARPFHERSHPVHVTVRAVEGLGGMRRLHVANEIGRAIRRAKQSPTGLRVIHFSIQSNHLHLIVEAADRAVLARGMQGLLIRIARAINRTLGRRGRVFGDRYHAHALATPREVRHAIAYVLLNHRKHDAHARGVDLFSSGRWFDGWSTVAPTDSEAPVSAARTWLAGKGWRRHRLIAPTERPGGEASGTRPGAAA